jgi:hypothetical protein
MSDQPPSETPTTFFQRQAAKLPTYWKLATIRCSIYAIIVGASSFDAGVEGYDVFGQMTNMQLIKLVEHVCVAMLGVWVAFLDQSLSKYNKPSDPPKP